MGVLPERILVQGFNSEVVPVMDNMKIGEKFFALSVLPREALAKELSNKDCNKTGGLFKPGFLFLMGFYKPSVICKKLSLSGGLLVEVNMAVLPERFFAKGFNYEVVPVKDNAKSAPLILRSVKFKSESLGGAKEVKRLQFC